MDKTELVEELIRLKKQFLYHKAIVSFIDYENIISTDNLKYKTGNYYPTKAIVEIVENGLSVEEHNKASGSINQWFLLYCSELIKCNMENIVGFNKLNRKTPLTEYNSCQLLYALRDKIAHLLYRHKKLSNEKKEYYTAVELSQEIRKRYPSDKSYKDNKIYSLPIHIVVIPLIDDCIKQISECNE